MSSGDKIKVGDWIKLSSQRLGQTSYYGIVIARSWGRYIVLWFYTHNNIPWHGEVLKVAAINVCCASFTPTAWMKRRHELRNNG